MSEENTVKKKRVLLPHSEEFISKLNQLKRFQVKYGHLCVPKDKGFGELGDYVHGVVYKTLYIKQKERNKLLSIGFINNPYVYEVISKQYDDFDPRFLEHKGKIVSTMQWIETYNKLKVYYDKYGHSNPPASEDQILLSWTSGNRTKFRKGKLWQVQIDALDKLNFFWNPQRDRHNQYERERYANIWDKMYGQLMMYKEIHGDTLVPQVSEKYRKLGRWVNSQRQAKVNGSLYKEREERLDKIGMVWNKLDRDMKNRIKVIKEVEKEMKGDLNAARVCRSAPYKERLVANYIYQLRRRGTSIKSHRKMIDRSLKFDWTPRNLGKGKRYHIEVKRGNITPKKK